MAELTILSDGPVNADAIDVTWEEPSLMPKHAQAHIDERWSQYMQDATSKGKSLFNAPVTKLIRARRDANAQGQPKIQLTLGPTDYKTFLVTVLRDRSWFEKNAPEAISPALGNSVLLTHRDRALLGIRSTRTSAYAGRAHLIGGVLDLLGTSGLELNAAGILRHLQREMNEEAGIEHADLAGDPILLAVARDEFLGQPELIWHWELQTDLEIIAKRIDPAEHDGCLFLDRTSVPPEVRDRMTPVARAAWERWRRG